MNSFYFNDGRAPLLSILLSHGLAAQEQQQGSATTATIGAAAVDPSAESDELSNSQIREVIDAVMRDADADQKQPVSSTAVELLTQVSEQCERDSDRERREIEERRANLPPLELKRFSIGQQQQQQQRRQADAPVVEPVNQQQKIKACGTSMREDDQDVFRMKLIELERRRACLLGHQELSANAATAGDLMEDLETLRRSLDVLKTMLAASATGDAVPQLASAAVASDVKTPPPKPAATAPFVAAPPALPSFIAVPKLLDLSLSDEKTTTSPQNAGRNGLQPQQVVKAVGNFPAAAVEGVPRSKQMYFNNYSESAKKA